MNIDRRTLPLTALRAYEAFGRAGSMSAAAETLGVTHSAISRQIRFLEEVLGQSLTEGPKSARRPTAAGQEMLARLTAGFDQLEDALRALPGQGDSVDVSCLSTLAMRWLIPRLFGFQTMHPGVRVRLSSDDGPVDVSPAGPDVAIRVGAGPWPDGYAVTSLFPDRVGVVLPPARMPSYPEEVLHMARLGTATRPDAWTDWARVARVDLPEAEETRFEHFHFLIEAVHAGLGAAVVPEILVAAEIASGRLVAPFGFVPSGMEYVALMRPEAGAGPRALCDWLAREAGASDQ